jgi:PAS domain S-box-containing protein
MSASKPSYKELQDRLQKLEKAAQVHEIAEAHLRQSEKRLAQILDSTSIPTFVIDSHHRVTHWNPACENLTAINAADVLGTRKQWMAFYPKERPILADLIVNQASQTHIYEYYQDKFRKSEVVAGAYEVVDFFPHLGDNGRWLFFTAAPLKDDDGAIIGSIETLQDITHQKRMQSSKETMLKISLALPEYPELRDLLDFISREVKSLIYVEGALVLLLDEKTNELYFQGTAYDDVSIQNRVKAMRFSLDELAAGEVIRTGQSLMIQDTADPAHAFPGRDRKLGYQTRSLLIVPLKSADRIIGVLCAINKKKGRFDQTDVDSLSMVAGATTLSIENARYAEELKRAYREVRSLNKAKDKAIRHLAHELRTPVTVLSSTLQILAEDLEKIADEPRKPAVAMLDRSLGRIVDIEEAVTDIMDDNVRHHHGAATHLLEQCADLLLAVTLELTADRSLYDAMRARIDQIYRPVKPASEQIALEPFINDLLQELSTRFNHRSVTIEKRLEGCHMVNLPSSVLRKVVEGLVKNAIENTPDHGRVHIRTADDGTGVVLTVSDCGIGLTEESQRRIFEGFFVTQDTMKYSSKNPYDFNAGGKGADLLRMKIFSERYGFQIKMASSRCPCLEKGDYSCPGDTNQCRCCRSPRDCYDSGGTRFSLHFP